MIKNEDASFCLIMLMSPPEDFKYSKQYSRNYRQYDSLWKDQNQIIICSQY